MKHAIISGICAISFAMAQPAAAAVLSFDLSGLSDVFSGSGTSLTGSSFVYDTDAQAFGDIEISGLFASYGNGSGILIRDTAALGFPDDIFLFTAGVFKFFLSFEGFDPDQSPLAVGESASFGSVFAFEADQVDADFVIQDFTNATFYFGDASITRLADVAPVPLPAALPLLLAGLGGLGLMARRRRS